MKTKIILFITLLFALVLDGTIISLPLVLGTSIFLYILYPEDSTILVIFLTGLFLDALRLNQIGATSIFLLICIGILYFYKNTIELKDLQFVLIFTFAFAFIYAIIFGYSTNLFLYIFALLIVEGVVYFFNRKTKPLMAV